MLVRNATQSNQTMKFAVDVDFSLPYIKTSPNLLDIQHAVDTVADEIVNVGKNVFWWAVDDQKTFHEAVVSENDIVRLKSDINSSIIGNFLLMIWIIFGP